MSPIDPTDFKPQGKPTLDQMRAVYVTLAHPTIDNLTERLVGMGYQIGRSAVGRAVQRDFTRAPRQRKETPNIPAIEQLRQAVEAGIEADPVGVAKQALGEPLTPAEIVDLKAEIKQLGAMSLEDLKAIRAKENLIYNIMLLRFSQRKAEFLTLMPKDSAVMVTAMSEAASAMPELASSKLVPHQGNGNGAMIDVTPNPQNEVSAAISAFRKKDSVAA